MTIRVRFAPSPTGDLHLGGARTALYNFLYAKQRRGEFLIRIEDTDKKNLSANGKEVADNIKSIKRDLQWLGIESDSEPAIQSEQHSRHKEVADLLLNAGKAFRCYDSVMHQGKDAARERRVAAAMCSKARGATAPPQTLPPTPAPS